MMLKTVVLVAVNVAVALAFLDRSEGRGCCTPKQWEGDEGFSIGYVDKNGQKNKMEGLVRVSYDQRAQQIAADSTVYNGRQVQKARVIQLYRKRRQYVIVGRNCTVTKLATKFQKACIPAGSQKFPTYLGSEENPLAVDMYRIKLAQFPNIEMSSTVTRRDCLPVGETLSGDYNGVSFMEVVGFFNITKGISNPDVFVPPEFCDSTSAKDELIDQTLRHAPHHAASFHTIMSLIGV